MPRISPSELDFFADEEDQSSVNMRRKLRKEKKESRPKPHMTPNDKD